MTYEKKYLKYKNKYFALKNIEQQGGFRTQCPKCSKDSDPTFCKSYLCPQHTNYMGVCVNNESICNNEYKKNATATPHIIFQEGDEELREKYDYAMNRKGYVNNYLNNSCLEQTQEPRIININNGESINRDFSILTLNVMGICRNEYQIHFAKLRANLLNKEIIHKQPDILCFQEMSQQFLDFFYSDEIRQLYPHVYENPINIEGKDIDCCIISKFKPKKIIMQNLDGVLSYYNTLQIIEFENLVIFNCYLQAGSKASPGQITKWMHYSRCRAQYFDYIKKLMISYNEKAIILLGDLNFDLNGTCDDWPELRYLQNIGLYDSWTDTNPGKLGLTEDTNKNFMRWNSKFEEKEYRYDAILYNEQLRPIESFIFGDESIKINETDNFYYETVVIPPGKEKDPKVIKEGGYDLFISDHFGVLSRFEFR